jgi:hypothetical protein
VACRPGCRARRAVILRCRGIAWQTPFQAGEVGHHVRITALLQSVVGARGVLKELGAEQGQQRMAQTGEFLRFQHPGLVDDRPALEPPHSGRLQLRRHPEPP